MPTGTLATDARKYHQNMVHYVSTPVVFSRAGTYTIGKLPAGAAVVDAGVVVATPFTGGTPQTLDIGVSGDTTDFASAIVLTAAGVIAADEMATASKAVMSVDTDVLATLSAGVTPTAGVGHVFVSYIITGR